MAYSFAVRAAQLYAAQLQRNPWRTQIASTGVLWSVQAVVGLVLLPLTPPHHGGPAAVAPCRLARIHPPPLTFSQTVLP